MVRKLVVLLMMRPKPPFFMCGKAALVTSIGARTLMAKKRSQISAVSSSMPGRLRSPSGRSDDPDAGIVDHRIEPAEVSDRGGDRLATRRLGRKVRADRMDAFGCGEPLQPVRVAIDRRDRMPGRNQEIGRA